MTLIELLVALAIIVATFLIGMPQLGVTSANSRIRTLAGSFLAGLQQARSEAIQRGLAVTFRQGTGLSVTANGFALPLSVDGSGVDWAVSDAQTGTLIKASSATEGSAAATVAVSSATATAYRGEIQFDSFGQAWGSVGDGTFATLAATVVLTFAPVANATAAINCAAPSGGYRCQQISVSPNGQIRQCDPAAAAGDTRAC